MADAFDQDLSHAYAPPPQDTAPATSASSDPFDQDLSHAYSGGEAPVSSPSEGAEWADYYKSGKATLQEMAARAMTGAQRFADTVGTQAASEANRRSAVDMQRAAEETRKSMSEGGRQIAEAQAIPVEGGTSLAEAAWNHPIDTAGIKGAQVVGSVAPYAIAGAVGGLPAEVAMGAADQATGSMQAAVGKSNEMTDTELAQASPRFAQLLKENPDAYQARVKFRDELYTTPQLAADILGGGAIGWVTGRTLGSGKAAIVGEKGVGDAERSALRSMGEQAAGNAAGGMATDYAQQRSDAAMKDATGQTGQSAAFNADVGQMLKAGVNAGVEGALAAGAPHAYAGARNYLRGGEPAAKPPAPKVTETGGDAAQNAALQATQQGVEQPIQPTQRQPVARPQQQAAPVTPEANAPQPDVQQQALNAAAARLNTQTDAPAGATPVTEPAAQLQTQAEQVQEGNRTSVVYPAGTENIPEQPAEGLRRYTANDGTVIDYDPQNFLNKAGTPSAPKKVGLKLERMLKEGTLSEENGYSRYSQQEVAQHAAQTGEQPTVLQSQTAEGQPINDVASTPSLKPEQLADMSKTLPEGGQIVEKPVDQVLAERKQPTTDTTGLSDMGGSFAKGATDSMYDAMWAKVQAGDTTEAGAPSPVLQAAKMVRERGGMKSPEELRALASDYAKIKRGPNFQNDMRALVERHSPAPTPETPSAVTSAVKTPERRVPKGAGPKAAETLGRVSETRVAKPDVAPRPAKAQDVLNAARGITEPAPAPKAKPTRRTKAPEEQRQGNAGPHERRARADANRLGAEIAARHKLDNATVEAAGKGDPAAVKKVETVARQMIADFHAEAKKLNEAHNSTRQGVAATTLSKEQVKIPGQYAKNIDASRAPSAGLAMLMEARSLSNKPKKFLQQFLARHVVAHKGDLAKFNEDIYTDRRAAGEEFGDSEKARAAQNAATRAGVEGDSTVAEGVDYTNPESALIAKEDAKALLTGKASVDEIAPAPRKPAPKKEPGTNTVMKESLSSEREKQVGETREVKETDKERIAREALERFAKKESAAPQPAPKKAEPVEAKEPDAASVWLRGRGEKVEDEPLHMEGRSDRLSDAQTRRIDHVSNGGVLKRMPNGKVVSVTAVGEARDLIKPSTFGKMWTADPKERVFMPMLMRRMLQVAGDTPVHVLSDTKANREALRTNGGRDVDGAYFAKSGQIYVFAGKNGAVSRHVLVHEVTHAATANGIASNAKLRGDIRKLMDHVLDQVGDQGWFERPGSSDIRTIRDHYGFRSEAEFIAEFGGNKIFRETLRDVPVSPEIARELGMKDWHRQTVYSAIIDRLRRFFRLPEKAHSALEAALMLTERSMKETEGGARGDGGVLHMESAERPAIEGPRRGDRVREQLGRLKRYMSFTSDIARKLDDLMGGGVRWARDAASTLESKHAKFNEYLRTLGGNDAVALSDKLRREYGDNYSRLVELTYDARHAGVDIEAGMGQFSDAINSTKGKAWLEKHGAEIERLRNEHPDLWKGMQQVRDTIDRYHTESAVGSIKSLLDYYKLEGVDHEGLARRFYNDTLSDRDKGLLGINDETKAEQKDISELLNAMHGLRVKYRKEAGTYSPFFREGSHWISAKRAVNYVGSGELTKGNEVHFEQREGETAAHLRERVQEFIQKAVKEHDYDIGDVHSGILNPEDPHGKLLEMEQDGPLVYRVPLKLDYAAKVDGEVAGRQRLAELDANNIYEVGGKTYLRHEEFTAPRIQSSSDFTSPGSGALTPRLDALRERLQKQDAFKMKDAAEQEAILKSLEEAALIGRAGTSSLSPNLLRARKVRGYDMDYSRAIASYIGRAAGDMAKADVMPKVEDALYKLNQQIGYRKDATQGHTDRAAYYEEFKNRLLHSTEMSKAAKHPAIRRLLQMTALDKLFGVSFHVVNATEAPILSGAALGGRHGFAQTYANMGSIYRMMGVGDLLKSGAKNTWGARDIYAKASDYPGMVREALSKTEEGRALLPALDHMVEKGLMSPEAEYFFHQESTPKEGKIGGMMSTADRMARQMTQVVETINRTVTGLAAYKMEKARLMKEGKTEAAAQKAALDYAHDTVKEVMGDYSNTNSGRVFDEQWLGAAMQFKKYAVKTYTLMGRMIGEAYKGDKEARRSFLGLMVLQGVAAGAMGLPFMEVAKQAYSAYNFAAGNEYDVDSAFEYALRSLAKELGLSGVAQDAAVHGVTRAIPGVGFDLGSRVGMDKLSGITLPKSTRKNDMLEWFGATLTGASESTIQELVDGLGKLRDDALKGPTKVSDVVAHVGNVLPIKAAADITKAAAGFFDKPETARGYKRSESYSTPEFLLKAAGLRPAREAMESETRNMDYVQTQIQQHQRTDFERRWARATTGDERARLWGEIERWNAGIADPAARLKRSDLSGYVNDFKKKSKDTVLGQEVHKRDKWIVERNKQLFGAR